MSSLVRYLAPKIKDDLNEKMVFLCRPRQVGKTHLSLSFLNPATAKNEAYLNWDDLESKSKIKNGHLPQKQKIIVLDEIHKYKSWRNLVKGFYDKQKESHKFIITGSARLDYYRKGGDSLVGRYHYHRLHPITLPELKSFTVHDIESLLEFGGFPEPFLKANKVFLKRWQRERHQRVLFEDIIALENIKEITQMENLFERLPKTVSSILSYQSLANDLELNIRTVQRWIDIFDQMYLTFRIQPFISGKIRLVKKTSRIYFWDWSTLEDSGPRFENFVASHLLKYCHYHEDSFGEKMELRYVKDVYNNEIDFVVLKNKKPLFAVECKTGDRSVSKGIHFFKNKLNIPIYYQVHLGKLHYSPEKNIEVIPFSEFCLKLGLV